MENNKEIAKEFQKLVIEGKIDVAYEKYIDLEGKHHNMHYPSDFNSLKQAMFESHSKFPNKKLEIKQIRG